MVEVREEPKCANCPMRQKAEKKTELTDGQILELAYNLVPGLESLPGVPGSRARLRKRFQKTGRPGLIWSSLLLISMIFGPIIALNETLFQQNLLILCFIDSYT